MSTPPRTTPDGPWDPGLQAERTRLAWQRTILALLAVNLVGARVVASHQVATGLILAAIALLLGGLLAALSVRRFRQTHWALHAEQELPDARIHLLTVALVVLSGATAAAYLIVS